MGQEQGSVLTGSDSFSNIKKGWSSEKDGDVLEDIDACQRLIFHRFRGTLGFFRSKSELAIGRPLAKSNGHDSAIFFRGKCEMGHASTTCFRDLKTPTKLRSGTVWRMQPK